MAPSFSQLDVDVDKIDDDVVDDLFFDEVEFHLLVIVFFLVVSDGHAVVEGLEDFDQPPTNPVADLDLFPQPPLEISGLSFAFTKVSLCTDGDWIDSTKTSLSVIIFSVTDIPVLLVLCLDLVANDSFDVSLYPSRPVELVWLVVLFWWLVSGITSLPSLIMLIYCVTGNS